MTKWVIYLFSISVFFASSVFATEPYPAPNKLLGAIQCSQRCVKAQQLCYKKSNLKTALEVCDTDYSQCLKRCSKGVPAITARMSSVPGGFPCPKKIVGRSVVGCWVGQCRKSRFYKTYYRYALAFSAMGHYKHMRGSYVSSNCKGTMSSIWSNSPGPLNKVDHSKAPTYTLYRKIPTSHGIGDIISFNYAKLTPGVSSGGYRKTVIVIRGEQLCFHEGHFSHTDGLNPKMAFYYDRNKPPKIDMSNCLTSLDRQ